MILLAIIAVVVIPPEKLPDAAKQLARFLNDLRKMTSGIWDDIKQDAILRPEDLMKRAQQNYEQNLQPDLKQNPNQDSNHGLNQAQPLSSHEQNVNLPIANTEMISDPTTDTTTEAKKHE